jgi:DNA repair exonuclease SbcCD ATPase subunit
MSQSVYLNRLHVQDFRTFGDFELALPPGPGVTIVWGPNGLGKTNLFAAIEWGLTNKVERLWQTKASHAEKAASLRRDGTGEPSVTLSYTDGMVIRRTLDVVTPAGFEETLMNDGWPTKEFPTALRFTHLLGQSADQHLVRMEENERWTYVGPITRLKEVWDIQRKLGAQFTRESTRFSTQATEALANTKAELERFVGLRDQRDRLRDLARAAQAVSPEDSVVAVADIMRQLRTVYELEWGVSTPRDAAEMLADLGTAIQRSIEQWRSIRSKLDFKYAEIDRHTKVVAAIADLTIRIEDNDKESDSAAALAETFRVAAAEVEKERDAALKRHFAAADRVTELGKLRSLVQRSREVAQRKEDVSSKLSDVHSRRLVATVGTEPTRAALIAAEEAAQAAAEAKRRLGRAATLVAQVQTVEELERGCLAKEALWKQSCGRSTEVCDRIDELSDRIRVIAMAAAELKARLKFERQRADAIFGAVAVIAEAINSDVSDCPVCGTPHPPGRLKELVKSTASSHSPHLAELEAELASQEVEESRLSEERARLEEEKRQLEHTRHATEQARGEVERQLSQLKAEPEFAGAALETMSTVARTTLDQAQSAAADAISRAASAGNVDDLRVNLQERLKQVETLNREYAEVAAAAEDTDSAAREVASRIAAFCKPLGLSGEWQSNLTATIALAVQEEERASGMLRDLEGKLSAATGSTQEAAAKLREVKCQRGQLEAELQARQGEGSQLTESWLRSGLNEPVGTETLQNAIEGAEKKLVELTAMTVRHEGLVSGLAGWKSAGELNRCEEFIASWLVRKQCDSEEALLDLLMEEVRVKEKRLHKLAEVERQRERIRNIVKDQNRRIQEVTLQPLNGLLNAFTSVLMTQQSHEMRLDCRFGVGAVAGIVAKDLNGKQVNPELYLSEGQLGAVNLALLFSANLTYPWSRWPALLIDDPLQYSDIISASAFMDLVCNLVRERNLQVILSTHDSSEADFCRRKCVAADIPTQDCQLLANSQNGVQFRAAW